MSIQSISVKKINTFELFMPYLGLALFLCNIFYYISLYTTNFTEPLSYQDSAFLKLPKFP